MSNSIFKVGANDNVSALFTTTTTNNSADSTGIIGLSSQYSQIKNGSYSKLLKQYYKKLDAESKAENEDSDTTLSKVKASFNSLAKSAKALNDSSLYAEGDYEVTSASGEKTKSKYNYDAIYDKLNSFVDSYNSAIKAGASSDTKSINAKTLNTIFATTTNSSLLSNIGVTADKDGYLSIDRDKFNSASISTLKSLFNGQGTYADTVASKANLTAGIAEQKLGGAKTTYSSSGSSSKADLSSLYDTIV